jgi:AmmeMemoRadiSam system protein A
VCGHLTQEDKALLRVIALDSLKHGLEIGRPLEADETRLPQSLREPGATFVTLQLHGRLRGCVGTFEASRSLAEDVANNAYSAAFMDFRFPPLSADEFPDLEIHISLLTPLQPMEVESREDLLGKLRPGIDGLLLEDAQHRSTFLPQVWESLPDPEDFLGELFLKAGLPRDHWSGALLFHRYEVEEF